VHVPEPIQVQEPEPDALGAGGQIPAGHAADQDAGPEPLLRTGHELIPVPRGLEQIFHELQMLAPLPHPGHAPGELPERDESGYASGEWWRLKIPGRRLADAQRGMELLAGRQTDDGVR
jgi:hypothetical protein